MDVPVPLRRDIETALNVPLDHNQLGWIGLLSVTWAHFEFLVEAAIYHLRDQTFDEGRQGPPIERDISARLKTLRTLAEAKLARSQRLTLLDVCERGIVAAPRRNLAIHGNWMPNHDIGAIAAVSWFKVSPGEPLKSLPFDQIIPLSEETAALGLKLLGLLQDRGLFPP